MVENTFVSSTDQLSAAVQAELSPLIYDTGATTGTATSIDITGLNANTYGGIFEVTIAINSVVASAAYSLYLNNDTAAANYFNGYTGVSNTGANTAAHGSDAILSITGGGVQNTFLAKVLLFIKNGVVVGQYTAAGTYTDATPNPRDYCARIGHYQLKGAAETNITQITLTSSAASSIGAGSRITIRKVI